ncbi:SNF2 family N-terminal domain-containing protein [Sordaria sp. MPI-SDFR-AT-0083]|nr:SNF2 family N-terminal domain-containing protein [Sordaria sp. MPI-SDFR-AT-0083]
MLPDRSNPKRRRLESSSSGESVNIGFASNSGGEWPSYLYLTPSAGVAAPSANSFPSLPYPPNPSCLSLESQSYSQYTAIATPVSSSSPDPLTTLSLEQHVWSQPVAIGASTTAVLDAQLYWPFTWNTHPSLSIPDPWDTWSPNSPFQEQATGITPGASQTVPSSLLPESPLKSLCEASTTGHHPSSDSFHDVPAQDQQELVCFGELPGIPARFDRHSPWNSSTSCSHLRVTLNSSSQFSGKVDDQEFSGTILADITDDSHDWTLLTDALLNESGIELSVICLKGAYPLHQDVQHKASKDFRKSMHCKLLITIFGSLEMFEDIGSFFQEYEVYLQDPTQCDRHVRYCNPHRLSSTDPERCIWTSDLGKTTTQLVELAKTLPTPGILDAITSAQDLPEADQPRAIQTTLARHQRQALTFMQRREEGWSLNGERQDIWKYVENRIGDGSFVNRISGSHQCEEPEEFQGGIIADPMGLGKTLTMIALTASDLMCASLIPRQTVMPRAGQTLVVVPPPLLGTWEEQLAEHVVPGAFSWYRHHGNDRLTASNDRHQPTIVLTTYHTVSAEWKKAGENATSCIFSRRWRRIILDEAHFIRNRNSQMAHAICALDGESRWAVTGTPIQNKLSDIATLLKFLRIYPYSEKTCFDADITHLWKTEQAEEALKRFKRLASCLILRRPATTIQLPARRNLQCPVEFLPAERELYQDIRNKTVERLDELLYADNADGVRSPSYVNVLQQIEAMRMVCNLGLYYRSRHDTEVQDISPISQSTDTTWNSAVAQRALKLQLGIDPVRCKDCKVSLDETVSLLGDTSGAQRLQQPLYSQCMKFVCSDCISKRRGAPPICDHNPICPFASISLSAITADESSEPADALLNGKNLMSPLEMPAKVKSLISQLRPLPYETKSVVFSTWRTTLDVIEAGLKTEGIPCLRFDGKVPQRERQNVVNRFRQDPSCRVLLLTLSCGAVGLTLTVASYAFLMEPHWCVLNL